MFMSNSWEMLLCEQLVIWKKCQKNANHSHIHIINKTWLLQKNIYTDLCMTNVTINNKVINVAKRLK